MPRMPADPRIRLPHAWPRRVRSAVIHAVAMARVALAVARARAERNGDAGVRLQVENDRLRQEVALLIEEVRIKDARMSRLPAQRRPHYPPIERLAILALRAARGWSAAETARRLLVTPLTVAAWTGGLDDGGPHALLQVPEPVNRFLPQWVESDFVRASIPAAGTNLVPLGRPDLIHKLCALGS